MSNIVEYALTRNNGLLLQAGKSIENSYYATTRSFENLIMNHIGSLLGINECTYIEAYQYVVGDMLTPNADKARQMLEALSSRGYRRATKDIASEHIDSDPMTALQYYMQCLNDPSVEQGEVNEHIGFIYFKCDELNTRDGVSYLKTAADQYNRSFAQYLMAYMLFYGLAGEKDLESSFRYCVRAANNGDDAAQYWLGKDYIIAEEYPLNQNYEKGVYYLTAAAKQGNGNAQYLLGLMYYNGDNGMKNLAEAERYFESAAQSGVPGAYAYLGKMAYDRGDYSKAKEQLEIAYYRYHTLLWAGTLAGMYKNGTGCTVDVGKAIGIIDDMIENNESNPEDIVFAAECYYNGTGVIEDVNKAVRYYFLVEDIIPSVKYKLGCIALEGTSGMLSPGDCVRYFETAGNNGYSLAYSKLGNYFMDINNPERALEYFKKSFQAGNADDGVMVGRIIEVGTPSMYKNMTEAVKWYQAAAERGSSLAKEELTHIKSTFLGYKRV